MRVRSRHLTLFASLALFVGAACSENDTPSSAREVADAGTNDEDAAAPSTETDGGAGAKDAGRDAPKVDAASSDAASGDAASSGDGGDAGDAGLGYPTAHLGTNPRVGSTPGDVIHDYAFTGYRATGGVLDTSTLRTIRLADFNVDIDLRSMEILAAEVGAPANLESTVDAHLTWVATHAPSWP